MDLERTLLTAFASNHPTQAGRTLESMSHSDAADVLAITPEDPPATEHPTLNPPPAASVLALVSTEQAARALSKTRRQTAAAILRATASGPRVELLGKLGPEVRRALEPLLRYEAGTAGALMDPEVLSCDENISVSSAMKRIRRSSAHALYYMYIVDDEQRLVGVVNLAELMATPPNRRVGLIAKRPVESLPSRARSESIIRHPAWKRFHALPVVDPQKHLLGVVRCQLVRELEGRFLEGDPGDQSAETAAALGEVYGLGLRGLFEWAASALLGSSGSERRQR